MNKNDNNTEDAFEISFNDEIISTPYAEFFMKQEEEYKEKIKIEIEKYIEKYIDEYTKKDKGKFKTTQKKSMDKYTE
jgi:hypothetical protein